MVKLLERQAAPEHVEYPETIVVLNALYLVTWDDLSAWNITTKPAANWDALFVAPPPAHQSLLVLSTCSIILPLNSANTHKKIKVHWRGRLWGGEKSFSTLYPMNVNISSLHYKRQICSSPYVSTLQLAETVAATLQCESSSVDWCWQYIHKGNA